MLHIPGKAMGLHAIGLSPETVLSFIQLADEREQDGRVASPDRGRTLPQHLPLMLFIIDADQLPPMGSHFYDQLLALQPCLHISHTAYLLFVHLVYLLWTPPAAFFLF